jgi:hypothetical protein
MGSYLDKPIVDKNSHSSEAHGLEFGVASMQGWRVEMEDAHTIIETIGKPTKWRHVARVEYFQCVRSTSRLTFT